VITISLPIASIFKDDSCACKTFLNGQITLSLVPPLVVLGVMNRSSGILIYNLVSLWKSRTVVEALVIAFGISSCHVRYGSWDGTVFMVTDKRCFLDQDAAM
jgi:hypothetical protein